MAELEDRPKRKSVAFANSDEVVDSDGNITEATNGGDKHTAESHKTEQLADPAVDEVTDMFASLAKKKKPKKKKDEEEGGEVAPAGDGELDLSNLKKKKKKPKSKTEDLEKELASGENGVDKGDEPVADGDPIAGTGIWQHDASQDIPYPMLLGRFFTLLHERHPDIAGGAAKSFRIPPPQCLREGNKKTLLANLPEICKRLKRNDEHVISFLFAELGTSGSVDASRRLIIRGKFQSKQIEAVLRRYIMDYCLCKTCRSPDTELSRGENRLNFLQCNSCGSRRSVQAIRTGFSAQIGKRKRQVG